MDSGDTVTNVVTLQIKTVRLRDPTVLLDESSQKSDFKSELVNIHSICAIFLIFWHGASTRDVK